MKRNYLEVGKTVLFKDDPESVRRAAKIICRGGIVAFPTETVYGLGASAFDPAAVRRIFMAKGRPQDNPLIVHIAETGQLNDVAADIPDFAGALVEKFWPGPLSLIMKRSESIAAEVSAGLQSVAVRMPDHSTALQLINACGLPIAAPSANRSGRPSPTTFKHVLCDLAGRIDAVIMSSRCAIGVESTVLDITGPKPVILRPGSVTREELEKVLNCRVALAGRVRPGVTPASPGMKYRHYSPFAPLILVTGERERRRILLETLKRYYRQKGLRAAVFYSGPQIHVEPDAQVEQLASELYAFLREADIKGADLILAEDFDPAGLGLAVMNRLRRAASRIIRV